MTGLRSERAGEQLVLFYTETFSRVTLEYSRVTLEISRCDRRDFFQSYVGNAVQPGRARSSRSRIGW
jgi:hypothetical protein